MRRHISCNSAGSVVLSGSSVVRDNSQRYVDEWLHLQEQSEFEDGVGPVRRISHTAVGMSSRRADAAVTKASGVEVLAADS